MRYLLLLGFSLALLACSTESKKETIFYTGPAITLLVNDTSAVLTFSKTSFDANGRESSHATTSFVLKSMDSSIVDIAGQKVVLKKSEGTQIWAEAGKLISEKVWVKAKAL